MKKQFLPLNILHIFNDGYEASFLLLLPFIANELHLSLTQVGFLGTLFNSLGILLAIPAGYIAIRFGGMRALVWGLFVYSLGFLLTGFAPNYYLLIVTFILTGTGFGIFHPIAFPLIAKWSSVETRGKHMGDFTAIGDVGRIAIAAALTFIIVYIGWRQTAIIYAVVAFIGALLLYSLVRSTPESSATQEKSVIKRSLREIVTHKKFVFATLSNSFDNFASNSLFIFLPFLLLQRGVSPALLGSFAAAFFVGNFLGKTLLGRFVDKFGTARVFIVSNTLMAFFIIILANSTHIGAIITCSIILGVFTKGTKPVLQTMVSESADHHGEFEKTFAANEFFGSISDTIAPLLLGFIADKLGIVAAFNMMAVIALLSAIPAFAFHRTRNPVKKL